MVNPSIKFITRRYELAAATTCKTRGIDTIFRKPDSRLNFIDKERTQDPGAR
jgi:hypothetical protein